MSSSTGCTAIFRIGCFQKFRRGHETSPDGSRSRLVGITEGALRAGSDPAPGCTLGNSNADEEQRVSTFDGAVSQVAREPGIAATAESDGRSVVSRLGVCAGIANQCSGHGCDGAWSTTERSPINHETFNFEIRPTGFQVNA